MNINPLLTNYIPMTEMLVETFGKDVEVVIHDLSIPEHSVVYVSGNVTQRQVGESFDQLIKQVILSEKLKDNYVSNYYFEAPNSRLIRSSTLLIRDNHQKLVGAICINIDTTSITQHIDYLHTLLPGFHSHIAQHQPDNEQPSHVSEMISDLINNILTDSEPQSMNREQRIEKIRFMDKKGIFLMKGSVEEVAEKLGVNKVTIYSYLDEVRGKR